MGVDTTTQVRTLSAEDLSREIGIVFSKIYTLAPADYDKYLGNINPANFNGQEPFGMFMVVDGDTSLLYNVEIEWLDGRTSIVTVPPWTHFPVRARRILSAGTTATAITILAGQ